MIAAAGSEVMAIDRYAHLVGGARTAVQAQDGVVDAHRVFGVPNRYITDGSTLPESATAPRPPLAGTAGQVARYGDGQRVAGGGMAVGTPAVTGAAGISPVAR